ncbi:DUF998 domain-containing protein [Nocardia goodfellowii]
MSGRRADPPGYDPSRHPVSGLALGPGGWVQTAGFVVCGVLGLVFVTVLWWDSESTAILVALWAIGMIGAGCFATGPRGRRFLRRPRSRRHRGHLATHSHHHGLDLVDHPGPALDRLTARPPLPAIRPHYCHTSKCPAFY